MNASVPSTVRRVRPDGTVYWQLLPQVVEPLLQAAYTKHRVCLRCRTEFLSTGDRLCGKCNEINTNARLGKIGAAGCAKFSSEKFLKSRDPTS